MCHMGNSWESPFLSARHFKLPAGRAQSHTPGDSDTWPCFLRFLILRSLVKCSGKQKNCFSSKSLSLLGGSSLWEGELPPISTLSSPVISTGVNRGAGISEDPLQLRGAEKSFRKVNIAVLSQNPSFHHSPPHYPLSLLNFSFAIAKEDRENAFIFSVTLPIIYLLSGWDSILQ